MEERCGTFFSHYPTAPPAAPPAPPAPPVRVGHACCLSGQPCQPECLQHFCLHHPGALGLGASRTARLPPLHASPGPPYNLRRQVDDQSTLIACEHNKIGWETTTTTKTFEKQQHPTLNNPGNVLCSFSMKTDIGVRLSRCSTPKDTNTGPT